MMKIVAKKSRQFLLGLLVCLGLVACSSESESPELEHSEQTSQTAPVELSEEQQEQVEQTETLKATEPAGSSASQLQQRPAAAREQSQGYSDGPALERLEADMLETEEEVSEDASAEGDDMERMD